LLAGGALDHHYLLPIFHADDARVILGGLLFIRDLLLFLLAAAAPAGRRREPTRGTAARIDPRKSRILILRVVDVIAILFPVAEVLLLRHFLGYDGGPRPHSSTKIRNSRTDGSPLLRDRFFFDGGLIVGISQGGRTGRERGRTAGFLRIARFSDGLVGVVPEIDDVRVDRRGHGVEGDPAAP